MSTVSLVGPPRDDGEYNALIDILCATFRAPRERVVSSFEFLGREALRVVRQDNQIAGGLVLVHMGQFFGGRSVPMTGIQMVGIAQHFRARGAGSILMRETVKQLHDEGVALSALYPATQPIYRRVGYEQAGTRFEIRLPLRMIELDKVRSEDKLSVRQITEADFPAVAELYRRRALRTNGNLDRSEYLWKRVRVLRGETASGFLFSRGNTPEGYLYAIQKDSETSAYFLLLTDLVALTPAAAHAALSHLAAHRSMSDEAVWTGTAADPVLGTLVEQRYQARVREHWMLRIVDVEKALTQRGYPPGISAKIELDVRDDLLPRNNAKFVLDVSDGKAAVTRGGRGTIRLDVRGLAAIYSSFLTPRELLGTSLIDASTDDTALATAGAIFAGPSPWMVDMF